jgi:hypothetical protein
MHAPEFAEAFRLVTGGDPTPLSVAAALKDPKLTKEINDTIEVIREQPEDERRIMEEDGQS